MNAGGPVLRDIHLPAAAWWPLAPGWWLLLVLAVSLAAGLAWWRVHRARRRPCAAALREVDALAAAFAIDGNVESLADAASRLLRRIARRIDPVAACRSGAAWRRFVHAHARGVAVREALDALIDARFRPQPMLDAPALLAALRAWCRCAMKDGHVRETAGGVADVAGSGAGA
jgi:hypothetical protein